MASDDDEPVGEHVDPPTDEEARAAAELRADLEGQAPGERGVTGAEILRALAAAHDPPALDEGIHQRLVEGAQARLSPPRWSLRPGHRVVARTFGGAVAGAVAIAAGFFVLVSPPQGATTEAALAQPHSTGPLFDGPFPLRGGQSERIDRIASARGAELRDNRFAKWGVR